MPEEELSVWREAAKRRGLSLTRFVQLAVRKEMVAGPLLLPPPERPVVEPPGSVPVAEEKEEGGICGEFHRRGWKCRSCGWFEVA